MPMPRARKAKSISGLRRVLKKTGLRKGAGAKRMAGTKKPALARRPRRALPKGRPKKRY